MGKRDDRSANASARSRGWAARGRRDDRGATMAEAAFVTPVFILLIFGIIEFSGYVAARTGANAAVKAGARMATVAGSDAMADREILNRMDAEGAGLVAANDDIEEVKIWRASGPDEEPPAVCEASTDCNLYGQPNGPGGAYFLAGQPLSTDPDQTPPVNPNNADCYFGFDRGLDNGADCLDGDRLDQGWPTKARRTLERSPTNTSCPSSPTPSSPPECQSTDYVGIWIKVRHDFWTGLFGDSVTVTSKTIAKIEPQGYDK